MPKRGKGHKTWIKGRHPDDVDYYEHDDRGVGETRRVSFKGSNRISKKNVRHERHVNIRHLFDQDIDMGTTSLDGETSSGRGNFNKYSPYVRGRGGYKRGIRHMGSNVGYEHGKLVDQTGWFRISIPYGAKHNKPALLGVLQSHIAPVELLPIAYRVENNNVAFFVDDYKTAEALQDADRKISMGGDRYKISVHVCPGMPRVDMNDALKERIKQAMVKRYNINTKSLDLARFHRDPDGD